MTAVGGDADRRTQLVRGVLDMCLLAMLREQPGHAYELGHRLQAAGLGETSYGTIYPLITRLRRLGLLTEHSEPSDAGPPRKVFGLSRQGQKALEAWSVQWIHSTRVVADLLVATGVTEPQEVER